MSAPVGSKIFKFSEFQEFEISINIIEKGVTSLDFVWKNKIGDKSELNFSAKNLLNPKIQQVRELTNQEDIILSSFQRGINIGIQYKYKF